jgi:hypothetical protein
VFHDSSNDVDLKHSQPQAYQTDKPEVFEKRSCDLKRALCTQTVYDNWWLPLKAQHGCLSNYVAHLAFQAEIVAAAESSTGAKPGQDRLDVLRELASIKKRLALAEGSREVWEHKTAVLEADLKAHRESNGTPPSSKKARAKKRICVRQGAGKVVEPSSGRKRLAVFENYLQEKCDEHKEVYEDVVCGLMSRHTVSQAAVVHVASTAKQGRIKDILSEQQNKTRKLETMAKLDECAALLDELCIPDASYHCLRMRLDLLNELPTLYRIRKNRTGVNEKLSDYLNVSEIPGGEHCMHSVRTLSSAQVMMQHTLTYCLAALLPCRLAALRSPDHRNSAKLTS